MSKELYIGGLPYSVSDGQLKEMFSSHGTIESARVIKGRFTRQSRGYGFVVMSAQAEADKAAKALNGTQLETRTLVVRDAHPQMIRKKWESGTTVLDWKTNYTELKSYKVK